MTSSHNVQERKINKKVFRSFGFPFYAERTAADTQKSLSARSSQRIMMGTTCPLPPQRLPRDTEENEGKGERVAYFGTTPLPIDKAVVLNFRLHLANVGRRLDTSAPSAFGGNSCTHCWNTSPNLMQHSCARTQRCPSLGNAENSAL